MSDLLTEFLKNGFGFDRFFDDFGSMKAGQGFPPFNISTIEKPAEEKDEEAQSSFETTGYSLEMAVAGFKREEIEVKLSHTRHGMSTLTVSGKKAEPTELRAGRVLSQGLARRSFYKEFYLADDVFVKNVSLEDGILSVEFGLKEQTQPKEEILQIT